MDVLVKICSALDCEIEDIVELVLEINTGDE
jgi:DNA-binding Xre family transcriptional regulator